MIGARSGSSLGLRIGRSHKDPRPLPRRRMIVRHMGLRAAVRRYWRWALVVLVALYVTSPEVRVRWSDEQHRVVESCAGSDERVGDACVARFGGWRHRTETGYRLWLPGATPGPDDVWFRTGDSYPIGRHSYTAPAVRHLYLGLTTPHVQLFAIDLVEGRVEGFVRR
jgi:hypothetical protein